MSEMEVSVFRQRSIEAIRQKARRGEYFSTVGVGYVKCDGDRIEKDPDRRVCEAISLIFRKFAELQTVRQVLVWIRQEQILVPVLQQGPGKQPILWKTPVYHTLHHILTNPVYAGAYAFGRRGTTIALANGRKRMIRTIRRRADSWEVLIKDHHDGYISWEEFARNQEIISDNANGKSYLGRGSVRRGEALLPGLFRCGRCGRKLTVHYGSRGTVAGWWFDGAGMYHGYLRDDQGNFTTFDVPGAAPVPGQSFPGAIILFPLAINLRGTVSGSYVDASHMAHCFVRSRDGNITTFDPANSVNTLGDASGIDRAGAISGGYVTADGVTHGFVRDPDGEITSFDGPDAGTMNGTGSFANMINDAGTIPGVSVDNNAVNHAFIRNSDGTFIAFDVTGAGTGPGQGTIAAATNLAGTTAGNY